MHIRKHVELAVNGVGKSLSINSLYEKINAGDNSAEEQLFSLLTVRFRLLAYHRIWNQRDAEDVVQNALLTVLREYRSTAISVSFAAWAYKVLDNKVLSYIKSKKQTVVDIVEDPPEPASRPGDVASNNLFRIKLLDCIRKVRKVNVRYGRAVLLHFQGYTTKEICKMVRVTPQNFYMILSRARAMLKRCLESGEIA